MRNSYKSALKKCFYNHIVRARASLGWTQAKMAETLEMDPRSYIQLDHGKTSCSATTLALFLVYVCKDVNTFVEDLHDAFEEERNQVA